MLTLTSLQAFNFLPSARYPSDKNRLTYSSGCSRLKTSALSPGVVLDDGPAWFSTGAVVIVYV